MFNEINVDTFLLEFDDDRSGSFEPLRFLPKGNKVVVLGIVSSKKAALEDKEAMIARIKEASQYAPLEQLGVSPQCGFSSTHHGNNVSNGLTAPVFSLAQCELAHFRRAMGQNQAGHLDRRSGLAIAGIFPRLRSHRPNTQLWGVAQRM